MRNLDRVWNGFRSEGKFGRRWVSGLGLALALSACGGEMSELDESVDLARGNGAPSGAHYGLNIIGVPKNKSADLTNNDGRRIFVPLEGSTRIQLQEGPFQVLDANGTDGTAQFQLPNPDPDNDGITTYTVYARALGTPGGSSRTSTCATDPSTGEVLCSTETLTLTRSTGRSRFTNVSRQLLYVYADVDGDGVVDRVPLFDDRLSDFFWQYDNTGLKIAQLRFYEIPTNVN